MTVADGVTVTLSTEVQVAVVERGRVGVRLQLFVGVRDGDREAG